MSLYLDPYQDDDTFLDELRRVSLGMIRIYRNVMKIAVEDI